MKPRTTHSTGSMRSSLTTSARPRSDSGTSSVADSRWLATMWRVRSNQNTDSPVRTLPLSGIGVGCTASYVEMRSLATIRIRPETPFPGPSAYISRTFPLASRGRSARTLTWGDATSATGGRRLPSGDLVEAPEHLFGVAQVGGRIEDPIELQPRRALVGGEQLAQRHAVLPRALGEL